MFWPNEVSASSKKDEQMEPKTASSLSCLLSHHNYHNKNYNHFDYNHFDYNFNYNFNYDFNDDYDNHDCKR